jgi:Rrf2 family nitric oxide-sensitive transcriptional repressor
MFSQTVEYALRAMVVLASRPRSPLTTHAIALDSRVPPDYLIKVLQSLARAGLVTSQRGKNGGHLLTRPPEGINILEVVNAVDPICRIRTCPLDLHGENLCPLHRKMDDALASTEAAFRSTNLAELLVGSVRDRPLCLEGEPCHV